MNVMKVSAGMLKVFSKSLSYNVDNTEGSCYDPPSQIIRERGKRRAGGRTHETKIGLSPEISELAKDRINLLL